MSNHLGLPLLTAGAFAEHPFNDAVRGVDAALTAPVSVNLVAGNVTLTAPQWRAFGFFSLTSGGNAGRKITLPAVKGVRIFRNAGAIQSINVVSGSTVITVAALQTVSIYNTGISSGIYLLSSSVGATGPVPGAFANFLTGAYTVGGSGVSYGAAFVDPGTGLASPLIDGSGMNHSNTANGAQGVDLQGGFDAALIGAGRSNPRTIYMEFVCPSSPANLKLRFQVVDGANFFYLDVYDDGSPRIEIQNGTGFRDAIYTSLFTSGSTTKLALTMQYISSNDRYTLSVNGTNQTLTNMFYTDTFEAGTASFVFDDGATGGPELHKFGVYAALTGTDLSDLTT